MWARAQPHPPMYRKLTYSISILSRRLLRRQVDARAPLVHHQWERQNTLIKNVAYTEQQLLVDKSTHSFYPCICDIPWATYDPRKSTYKSNTSKAESQNMSKSDAEITDFL